MYYGETSKIRQYLSGLGYGCSKDTGTAEHVLDCISRTNGGPEQQKESDSRLQHLSKSAITATFPINVGNKVVVETKHHHHKYHMLKFGAKKKGPAANVFKQFRLLLSRAFKETVRGKVAIMIKIVQQITLGAIYGGIYKVGNDQVRAHFLHLHLRESINLSMESQISLHVYLDLNRYVLTNSLSTSSPGFNK